MRCSERSYATLLRLPEDYSRRTLVLPTLWTFLQREVLPQAACQSSGCAGLLAVRFARDEHAATPNSFLDPSLSIHLHKYATWNHPACCNHRVLRCLPERSTDRPQCTFGPDVHRACSGVPLVSLDSPSCLVTQVSQQFALSLSRTEPGSLGYKAASEAGTVERIQSLGRGPPMRTMTNRPSWGTRFPISPNNCWTSSLPS